MDGHTGLFDGRATTTADLDHHLNMAAVASAMGFGFGDPNMTDPNQNHMMIPSAFPLTIPDEPIDFPLVDTGNNDNDVINNTVIGDNENDGSAAFAAEWNALLNDPIALDNLGLPNLDINTIDSTSIPPPLQPPSQRIRPSNIGTSSFPSQTGPAINFGSLAYTFDTTIPPCFPGPPTDVNCPPPLDLSMPPYLGGSSSTYPPAPPPSINSPFDTISNPFSPVVSTPGPSGFPGFLLHNYPPSDLSSLHQQHQAHLNQRYQHQQRRSSGFHPNQLPATDSYYQQTNRRHSQFASSPHSPPGFQFSPYLLNGDGSNHSPNNSFSSYQGSRSHTHSNLNPNPAPALFSPALSTQTDYNPFDFSRFVPQSTSQQLQQSPLATYPSRFDAGSSRSTPIESHLRQSLQAQSGPSTDPKTENSKPAIDDPDKAVPLPRKHNKHKKRSLPGSYSKDLIDSLIVVAKEAQAEKLISVDKEDNDPKDLSSIGAAVADPDKDDARGEERSAESNPDSVNAVVKGGLLESEFTSAKGNDDKRDRDQTREPSPLVEIKPRPIQEFLKDWERSPSPPPLLTGPPYRVRTESPESLKRLEKRRGKIVVRGGSLIGLGLGFSPKEEEALDASGCICDPLGLSGQDCWRKTTSSGGSRTRTTSRDADVHEDEKMNPNAVSGIIAGVKRKSGDDSFNSKGKLRDLQPGRPGVNPMLGKSNLEFPNGQAPAVPAVQAPKRKKPRVALSCGQCTKRKQKCNREIPCQHCTSRKVPELCKVYIPGEPLPDSTRVPTASRAGRKPKKSNEIKTEPSTPGAGSSTGTGTKMMDVDMEHEISSPATSNIELQGDEHRRRSSVQVPTFTPGSSHLSPFADHISAHDAFSPTRGSVAPSPFSVASILGNEELQRRASMNGIIHAQDTAPPHFGIPETINVTRQSSSGPSVGHRSSSRDGRIPFDNMSRSQSAGETAVDAAKWFATDGTVPGVETLRGDAKLELNLDDCGQPSENMKQLIEDCGVSPRKLLELVNELPQYTLASQLVDWFFKHINYVRYPIHEAGFRAAFEDMYRKKGEVGPEPHNVRSLPLIFIVLATSVRLAPEEWAGTDQERKMISLKMYWCSRRSILIATAIQPESLELVVTRLLSALYLVLIHDRRLTECWSQLGASLRTAQAIGLHRDGTKFGLDPVQTEYRRRVWSFLYHADRNYSLILGRPPSIIDAYCDTKEPMNLEFAKVVAGQTLVAKPFHEPTSSTFIILRQRFAKIVAEITYLFNKLHEPARFEEVEALDKKLRLFIEALPPHFRFDNPDKSLDRDPQYSYIPIHRFYLATEIFFIIITLHRPWLLRKLKSNKFALSRRACFDAAKMDFRIRQVFRADHPGVQNAYVGGQYREFNAAMIAGIYAIILPRGEDAEEMRSSLASFLEQRPLDKVDDLTSRREIAIIQTLYRRACQVLDPSTVNTSDAALLLGLRDGEASRHTSGSGPDSSMPADVKPVVSQATVPQAVFHSHNQLYPAFMSGAVQPGHGTVRPNALSKVVTTAPFQPLSLTTSHQHRLSMSTGSAGTNQDHKSPASIGSHEDEHPQRLLDKWLSANSSLALGNINTTDVDFGMVPMPMLSSRPEYADRNLNISMNADSTLGPSMGPEAWEGLLSPNGTTRIASSRDPITADQVMAFQEPQRDTFHGISDRMAGSYNFEPNVVTDPVAGFGAGLGDDLLGGLTDNFEHDDSYWNSLIDGILNAS